MWIALRNLFVVCIWLVCGVSVLAQELKTGNRESDNFSLLESKVINGDTIPHVLLAEVKVVPRWVFKSRREQRTYNRLVHNIKVTLPYARSAAVKLREIDAELSQIKSKKEQKQFIKDSEAKLFREFEGPLRKLTFSQGRLLIKLIDRETGSTSFSLIKKFKGGLSAFFWQSVARIFGSNLKDEYHSEREDRMIEHIIILIDNGML